MKTLLLVLFTFCGLQNAFSQSCTAYITAGGPTTFCEGGSVVLTANGSGGGGTWTQKTNFGGTARWGASSFSIGNKGYIGTGLDVSGAYTNDFWEYDPLTNAWTQVANFAGTARYMASGFSIENKGYIGTGHDSSSYKKDFWEFDPSSNTWTQKADFGGSARGYSTGLSIGNKGYIGTGHDGGQLNDFWEYDPITNVWTKKANFGGIGRYGASGFTIGNKGYLGTGYNSSNGYQDPNGYQNDFWEFDPSANTWTQKANFGGNKRTFATAFSIGNKGFFCNGSDYSTGYRNEVWQYDPFINVWTQKANFGGTPRIFATGFTIGNKGYLGTGDDGPKNNDFWEFDPGNSYLWSNGETTPTITVTTSGIYSVTITNSEGCSATSSESIKVSVAALPYATIRPAGPTSFCLGDTVTLSANSSGNIWTPKANFASARQSAVSFSIGNKGYLGTGFDANLGELTTDFWEYDPSSDAWTQKANFGGLGRNHAIGFNIGNKGYIGTGSDLNVVAKNDFWEYDPSSNTWTQKANVGGTERYTAIGFSIGDKGYVGTGLNPPAEYKNDFWEYNPSSDTWTQKANFGGGIRNQAKGFSIGNKGYAGIGMNTEGEINDFWEYDPSSDTWSKKANFGGPIRELSFAISIGNKGYIGAGIDPNTRIFKNDFWEYDPSSDTWKQKTDFGGSPRVNATGFSINNKGYVGTGRDPSAATNDFWEYDPGYTYLWSTGETTTSIKAYNSGSYSAIITNTDGCSALSDTIVVTVNSVPEVETPTDQLGCNGVATTAIEFTGGESETTYSWTNNNTTIGIDASGTGNIASFTAINTSSIAQVANITVTPTYNDCIGAPKRFTITIYPTPATPQVNVVNNCGNSVLSTTAGKLLTARPIGELLWSTGETTESITVTTAGTYTVTQTINGCASAAGSGTAAPIATPSTPVVNVVNNCGNSVLSTTAAGSLLWSTGETTSSITVTTAGTYRVTQTLNACTSAAGSGIAAPLTSLPAPEVSVVNNCGSSVLSTTAAGSLLWSTGETTSSITVTSAGTYTVTQTLNTCTSAAGSGTAAPIATPSTPDVNVVNNCGNSVLSTTATGNLLWSTGETTSSITVNTSGTYTVTQTVSGCSSASGSGIATPNPQPSVPIIKVDNNCGFTILSTTATGNLLWSTGSTSNAIIVRSADTYTVTRTINGCTSTAGSAIATPLTAPVLTVDNISIAAELNTCKASVAFASNVNVTGVPTPSVLYSIGTLPITSPYVFPVGATNVNVTASNSCGTVKKIMIVRVIDNQPPVIVCKPGAVRSTKAAVYSVLGNEFDATVTDNCGKSTMTYSLSGATVNPNTAKKTTLALQKLNIGTTTITWRATDESNNVSTCTTVVTVTRTQNNNLTTGSSIVTNSFTASTPESKKIISFSTKVIPNPTASYFTIELKNNSSEKISITVVDVAGRIIEQIINVQANSTLQLGRNYAKGIYFAEVMQGKEKIILKLIKQGD